MNTKEVLEIEFRYTTRLVSNCCWPTKGVQYFARIVRQDLTPVPDAIKEIFSTNIQ